MNGRIILMGMITIVGLILTTEVFASTTMMRPQFDGPRAGSFSAALFFGAIGVMVMCFVFMAKYRNSHPNRIKYLAVFAGLALVLAVTIFALSSKYI